MMDLDLPLTAEDYSALANFLEARLSQSPTDHEADDLRRRLARLCFGPLKDPERAHSIVEPMVAKDPGNDPTRLLYLQIVGTLGTQLSAAETLGRALEREKANDVRERVAFDVATLYLQEGELRQARATFLEIVQVDASGSPLALAAAHRLLDLEGEPGDPQITGAALEMVANASSRAADRHVAGNRLLTLHAYKPLEESRLAIAFQSLIDSPRSDEALAWLRAFYAKKGDKNGLAGVYRRQALRATDLPHARSLALRSIEAFSEESEEARIQQWIWFVDKFGPDRQAHAALAPLFEHAHRWDELCRVLEAEAELAAPAERSSVWARLGQTRLDHLGDADGALAAFDRCLRLDPANALALSKVETFLSTGDRRLAAADVLESVYRDVGSYEGQLRVLETRAALLPDPKLGLACFAEAVDLASAKLVDLPRAMDLCGRALRQALACASDAVLDWVVRLEGLARKAQLPDAHATILLGLLGEGPIASLDRIAIAISAIEALQAANAPDRALDLCRRAIEADPSSPELLRRVDELLGSSESPGERLARYEAALELTPIAGRRSSLRHMIAVLRRDSLGDLTGAADVWRTILAEEPSDFPAYVALVDATSALGDTDAALDVLDVARMCLRGVERSQMTMRKARTLVHAGSPDRALDLCREVVDEGSVPPAILQEIATLAKDEKDPILYRRALELLAECGERGPSKLALETLGDFQFDALGDRAAAVESWKAAARMCDDSPAQQDHSRLLYERAIAALPADAEAAEQLVELYARSGDWAKIPNALRVVSRSDGDSGRCVLLVLRLEVSAVQAGALEEFVSLVDEHVGRLGRESPEQIRALTRARARALASDPERRGAASEAYRDLVEAYGSDEDVREFELLLGAKPAAEERHRDRRWLYRWRAAQNPRSPEVLTEWARAEEEYGAANEAIALYERLSEIDTARSVANDALCRLKLHSGDFAGALAAFRALRCGVDEDERLAVDQRMTSLLGKRSDRRVETAGLLALTLAARPRIQQAHDLARQLLADPASSEEVANRIEGVANGEEDALALRIFDFLVSSDPASATATVRRRWFERVAELSRADPSFALPAIVRGASELADAIPLWEAAERIVRDIGHPEVLAAAYHRVLLEQDVDAALAEVLGRRMVRFEEERAIESPRSIEALLKVLALAPSARWALDRVKLALGAEGRYGELFALFDRAIEAANDDVERGDLLYEAAFAARDLAGQPRRAIAYFEAIHALRTNDATVEGALERLYERQGQRAELIALLDKRSSQVSGFKLRDLQRRIVSLWLELGEAGQAWSVIERMLAADTFIADVIDLIERLVEQPVKPPGAGRRRKARSVHERAIELLRGHYESLGRVDDVVRIAERSLALAMTSDQRSRCVRDLVRLRLTAAERGPSAFAQVIPRVASDVASDPRLAKIAFRVLLGCAIRAMKRHSADALGIESPAAARSAARIDAEDGALRAIQRLNELLQNDRGDEASFGLLYRCSRLPFDPTRRRQMLCAAALACAERLRDSARAIRIFGELFDDNPRDEVAEKSLGRFTELLDAAGEYAKLASLYEERASIRGEAGNAAEERAFWERAAHLWERQEAWEKAIEAYRRGAALGSEASLAALARIHVARHEWADAANALEWLFAHAPPNERALRALRLAEAYVEHEQRDRARACLERALLPAAAEDAESLPEPAEHTEAVRQRLIALYRQDEVWQPLSRLLATEAQRVDDPKRKLALLREAADRCRWNLSEPDEAAALLARAIVLDPHDRALRGSLVEVLESLQQWAQAAEVLRDQIGTWGDQRSKERAIVHRWLARVLVLASRQADALGELRLAVEMHPGHPAALYDLARLALDLEQLDLSERTYRALLLAVRRRAENSMAEAPRRADVFLDLSEIALRKGDPTRAADLFDSAFDEAMEHGEDPTRLERILRTRGRHELLSRALERRVEGGTTLTDRAVALGELVALWANDLGQSPELGARIRKHADRIARDLAREDLTDASAWTALATVYASFGERLGEGPLAPLLEAAIPKLAPGASRSRLRVILARVLLEHATRFEAGIAVLASAAVENPADREAVELLSNALESRGRLDELVTVLEHRLRTVSPGGDANDFVDAAWRLGRALERVGRVGEALAMYEAVLDRQPTDAEMMRALTDRLEHLGSERAAEGLERWMAADVGAAPAVARRLVALRDKQGDAAGALRALDGAVAAQPHDPELLSLRSNARERVADYEGALSDLESASTLDSRYVNAMVELLVRMGDRADSPRLDADSIRSADMLIRLNRPKQARRELERLLARSPNHANGLGRMASLAAADGNWELASDTYRKLLLVVEKESSGAELARVAIATADACWRAGGLGTAREALERATAALSHSPDQTIDLERLCSAMRDWGRLANLLIARAERQETPDGKTDLLLQAAQHLLEEPSDPAKALAMIDLASGARPQRVDALLLWAKAQVALGHAHQALSALYDAAERSRGKRSPLLASIYLEIGRAHLAADEIVEAFGALEVGFGIDRRAGDIAMLLGLVAIDLEDNKTAERAFSAVTMMVPRKELSGPGTDGATKAIAFYHLASIAMAKGEVSKARILAAKAVGGDPRHMAARMLLEKLDSPNVAVTAPAK